MGNDRDQKETPIQVRFTNSKRSLLTFEWTSPKDGKSNMIDISAMPAKSMLTIRDYH